ncbi:MAG: single-stranded DNA-binding protein [Shinella sp.]|nr:single-stranded DNA-binding protein [Shinella sp.]
MSTRFSGEGNIGSAPDYREFTSGNDEPRRLLRLNVYFDNPVPTRDGYEDRGGFWAPVELWNAEPDWAKLYQKGMRVLVEGRMLREEWEDAEENERVTFKVDSRRIAILPYRIESVKLGPKQQEIDSQTQPARADAKPKQAAGAREAKAAKTKE